MRITPVDRKTTVRVVESSAGMNQFITQGLADDYHVISALDGQQGWEKARTENPAIIVIDAMIFAATSDAMIAEMRTGADWTDVPMLLISDIADEELKTDCWKTGAPRVCNKTFFQK